MLHFAVVALISFHANCARAQNSAAWWYFGDSAAVHFGPNGPEAVNTSAMISVEGNATLSDEDGNLLCYTNGITVWNNQHDTMMNGAGLLGGLSSTQAALIVPAPGHLNIFYLFTTFSPTSFYGFRYNKIDMTLDNGLGGIDSNVKNILLDSLVSEKLTAIHIPGQEAYWIVTARANTNQILAFKLDVNGVSHTPVISLTSDTMVNVFGYLRFNKSGTLLASCHETNGKISLYQFDPITGQVVDDLFWKQDTLTGVPFYSAYGAEFSPNGKLLYTASRVWYNGSIRQYDVSQFDSAAIHSSETVIVTGPATSALQLGPDQRIYVTQNSTPFLGRINNPNVPGVLCGFQSQSVALTGVCFDGLPNCTPLSVASEIVVKRKCLGDSILFRSTYLGSDSVRWFFGDPLSGANNTDTGYITHHVFSDTGQFTVTMIYYQAGGAFVDSASVDVFIYPRQQLNLGNDTILCSGDSLVIDVSQPYASFLWHDGSSFDSRTISQDENVVVSVFGVCDTLIDSVNVRFANPTQISFPDDTVLCEGDTLFLEVVADPFTEFSWSIGDTTANVAIWQSSSLNLLTYNACGTVSDSINILFIPFPDGVLPKDSIYCLDLQFYLTNPYSSGVNYLWNDSSTGPALLVPQSGTYWLKSFNLCDTLTDSFNIVFNGQPKINLGNDTFLCQGEIALLQNLHPEALSEQSITWSDGSNDSILAISEPGLYNATVTLRDCKTSDSIVVYPKDFCPERCKPRIPNIITPNGDGINDVFRIDMFCSIADLNFYIYNRWGQLVHVGNNQTHSWDGVVNGEKASEGTYFYILSFTDELGEAQSFRGNFSLLH